MKKKLFFILFAALALTILPLPFWLAMVRPAWVLLFIFYLQFYVPSYFSIPLLVLLGLSMDVLLATIIGEHIFSLTVSCWLSSTFSRRFSFYHIGQQMLLILLFITIFQLTLGLTDAFLGYGFNPYLLVGVPIVSALIWPWVRVLCDGFFYSISAYRDRQT